MNGSDEFKGCLHELSKEELVEKVVALQNKCNQLQKDKDTKPSKLQGMIKRLTPRQSKKKLIAKEINFKECNYRYIAFKVAYLGWEYDGLQSNEGLDDTIEGILKEALRRTRLVSRDLPVRFTKCGRTDKAVSAFTQIMSVLIRTKLVDHPCVTKWNDCMENNVDGEGDDIVLLANNVSGLHGDQKHSADTKSTCTNNMRERCIDHMDNTNDEKLTKQHPSGVSSDVVEHENTVSTNCSASAVRNNAAASDKEFDYILILNQVLPPEIRILAWTPVNESFSARWKCQKRIYHYYFPQGNLNVDKMNAAAQQLCGVHDFRNFAKLNVQNCKVFVRHMYEFVIQHVDESNDDSYSMCCAVICASGFLYHQVRNMMTVLFLIGCGKEEPAVIAELLDIEKNPKRPAYHLSPAYPLVLFDATFDDMKWQVDRCTAMRLIVHFKSLWTELAIKTCLVKELIEKLVNDKETVLTGPPSNFAGVQDDKSFTFADLNDSSAKQSACGDVNYNFLKDACTFTHKRYKKLCQLQKCKSFEEEVESLERKRQHSVTSVNSDVFPTSKRTCL